MVKKHDTDLAGLEAELEEAKKPVRGRPRREVTDEEAYRTVMLQQARAQTRAMKAMKAMIAKVGGSRPRQLMVGRYFLANSGQPGVEGFEAAVNELLAEWTSQGWYPVGHVTSQPGILELAEGGQVDGRDLTILWGHD